VNRNRKSAAADIAGEIRATRAKRATERAARQITEGLTFRDFLSSPDYFPQHSLDLSPALWAIVDASDGRPDLIESDELCLEIFHCVRADMPPALPRVVGVSAGRRGGKTSRLLAPKAVHLAWTVAAPNLRPGEIGRVAIVAPDKDTATATLNFVKGIIASSEVLRHAEVRQGEASEDPEDIGNAGSVTLRRPDGKLVDITVRAASAKGGKVRSRSLLGLLLDEACFLFADDGHTVNDRTIFDAAKYAIEPGGQIWVASTPWVEGEGLLEELIEANWRRGTQGTTAIVAARVGTRLLRPGWDPDGEIERAARADVDGEMTADREILAIPLRAGTRRYFDPDDIDRAIETFAPAGVEPQQRAAGADYAHTSDRSALALAERYPGLFAVALVTETPSSLDQKPSETYSAYAKRARAKGIREIASDGHSKANAREEYERHGVAFRQAGPTDRLFAGGRAVLAEHALALGQLTDGEKSLLKKQFSLVLTLPGPAGRDKIHIPRSSVKDAAQGKGTTHCDALVATLTALFELGSDEPELWTHTAERAEKAANQPADWAPPAGSTAALRAIRNNGRAPSGKFY